MGRQGTPRDEQRSLDLAPLALTATLAACAALPPGGPSVLMVPPKDKSIPRFQAEDLACRQHASDDLARIMSPPAAAGDEQNPAADSISYSAARLQPIYDSSYVKCMSAYGNVIPPEAYLRRYGYPYPYRYSYVFPVHLPRRRHLRACPAVRSETAVRRDRDRCPRTARASLRRMGRRSRRTQVLV